MRSRLLLLALLAAPVISAATPHAAAAQSRTYRYRDHGRTHVYYGYDSRGYRNRIYIPSHRYKEPERRSRTVYRSYGYNDSYRYRDGNYGYRDGYAYRDSYGYRDGYYYRDGYRVRRRHANVIDLVLAATGVRYRDRYYGHRHTRRCRHGGLYISL
ncbi:MAG TPA: hypothetical protein VF771_08240 [Longimicrobiaceae bacterium]